MQRIASAAAVEQAVRQRVPDGGETAAGRAVMEGIVRFPAVQVRNSGATREDVVARLAVKRIRPGITVDPVGARSTPHMIIAGAAVKRVSPIMTVDEVSGGCSCCRTATTIGSKCCQFLLRK